MEGFTLSSRQRGRLVSRLRQAQDVRVYRRTLAVVEVGRGKPVAEVARTLGVTRQSVYNWIGSYAETSGPDALQESPRLGRPRLWTQDSDVVLEALLQASPEHCGYPGANWTVPWLQEQLARNLGRRYSDDTVRRGLHGLGYVWKRSRYVLEPDPERGEKDAPDSDAPGGPGSPQRDSGRG